MTRLRIAGLSPGLSGLPGLAWLSLGLLSPLLPVLLSVLALLGLARSLTGQSLLLAVSVALLPALLSPPSTLMAALPARLLLGGLASAVLSARAVVAGGLLTGPTLLTASLLGVLRGIPRLCGLVLWVGTRWLGVLTLRLGLRLGLWPRLARRLVGLLCSGVSLL